MAFSYDKLLKWGLSFSALVSLFDAPNMIALYVVFPIVFLYCFTRYRIYYENRYIVIFSLLIGWILLSCVTTNYIEQTVFELKALLGTIMMCYIVCSLSHDKEKIPFLYSLWIIYYIGIILYIPQMEVFKGFDYSKDRLNDSQLNANTIAYHTFYLTYVFFILGEILKKEKNRNIWNKIFFLSIPLSFVAALLTGSRQVLVIQVPLILVLISIRYSGKMRHAKLFIVGIIALGASCLFAIEKGKDIFEHSVLASRYDEKVKEDSRTKLLEDAINVGCEYPILGVGPGNYVKFSYNKHFSHCTYTELFANCGIIAVFLYVYMLWVFIKKQVIYYIQTRDKLFLVFLVFGVFYTFDNFFYVFYYSLWLLPFFFLIATHADLYYKELTCSVRSNNS